MSEVDSRDRHNRVFLHSLPDLTDSYFVLEAVLSVDVPSILNRLNSLDAGTPLINYFSYKYTSK